jgi:hypothetical protein
MKCTFPRKEVRIKHGTVQAERLVQSVESQLPALLRVVTRTLRL